MKRYVIIWLILLGMTWLTWFTGRMDLGSFNIVIAMIIATTKASLVVMFFMHLWDAGSVNRLVFAISILFVIVMMLGTFGDLMFRLPVTLPPGGTRSTL